MPSIAEKVYLASPGMLRNVGATLQGLALNHRRYGKHYKESLRQILDRQGFTREQLAQYQDRRLRELVKVAAFHVPYYRSLFHRIGLAPADIRGSEDLRKIPILEKEAVRSDPRAFLDERLNPNRLYRETTTGTTGTPITVFMTPRVQQVHYAFVDVRCRWKVGLQIGQDPYVTFGARHVVKSNSSEPPFWCYNAAGEQLYMSVYHLAPQHLHYYCEELKRRRYRALVGFPSVIATVARYILQHNISDIQIPLALTSGETLHEDQRSAIENAFGCKVFDQFGCSELSVFAAELPCGRMHVSTDYGVTEIVDETGTSVPDGRSGHLVCTGFVNDAQLLLRYRIGDIASFDKDTCHCGSPFPVLASLEGRASNAIVLQDGRQIFRMSAIDADIPEIKEYQIVQENVGEFAIYVVPSKQFESFHADKLRRNFTSNVGPVGVQIKLVESIDRGPGGKFASIISKVSARQEGMTRTNQACNGGLTLGVAKTASWLPES